MNGDIMEYHNMSSPLFDEESQIIQNFVEYHKVGGALRTELMYSYYLSNALSYYSKCRRCGIDDDFNSDFKTRLASLEKARDEIIETDENRYEMIRVAVGIFEKLSKYLCEKVDARNTDPFKYNKRKVYYYPLTNGTGYFGYNSYLYALFNNIQIAGVPDHNSPFDTEVDPCPYEFMGHDYNHYALMHTFGSASWVDTAKDIYLSIHQSSMDDASKEQCIFSLFFFLHEQFIHMSPYGTKIKFIHFSLDRSGIDENNFGLSINKEMVEYVIQNYDNIKDEMSSYEIAPSTVKQIEIMKTQSIEKFTLETINYCYLFSGTFKIVSLIN